MPASKGVYRFLGRVYRFVTRNIGSRGWREMDRADADVLRKLHQTLQRITEDFDTRWHFNTSIALDDGAGERALCKRSRASQPTRCASVWKS